MRYIAMNNFQIAADQAEPFEERWRRRRSYLQGAPGFESFQLLRGESHNGTDGTSCCVSCGRRTVQSR